MNTKKTHFMARNSSPNRFLALALFPIAFALSSTIAAREEPEAADTQPAARWDQIAFVVKSWGETVTQWQYTPEYGGVWIEVEPGGPDSIGIGPPPSP